MKKSYLIAIVFTILIIIWMGLGLIFKPSTIKQDLASKENTSSKEMVVEVKEQIAKPITSYITAQGYVMPKREVTLRAETKGKIEKILLKEGSLVKSGDAIVSLEINDRNAKLAKAISKNKEEQRKYKAAKTLDLKGYAVKIKVDEAYTALKTAQLEEKQIRLEIEQTTITAPFSGIVDRQKIEIGDYLSVGDEIVTIVDNSSLLINIQIPQHEIAKIYNKQKATINLATGQKKEGIVVFISPRAEQATKTFRVEIKVLNPDGLPSGTSATAKIAKPEVMVHFISPSLLTLNKEGASGIKTVNEENLVEFYPVEIISAKADGIYVSGLPKTAKIITVGQGFVSIGEKVSYVFSINKAILKDTEKMKDSDANN